MRVVEGRTFNENYPLMVSDVMQSGHTVGSRDGRETKELIHYVSSVADSSEHLVTSWSRPVNVAFMLAEVIWILGGRRDVEFLKPFNDNIANYSDDGLVFNAAYGYRLRHHFGIDQLDDVMRTLTEDPNSRQAVLQTWDPVADAGHNYANYKIGGEVAKRETKDRACNTQSQLIIRGDRLHWTQLQRSNDLIWGTPYNYFQFSHLHRWVADLLGIPTGEYTHVVSSLHVYEDWYEEADSIRFYDLYKRLTPDEGPAHLDWGKPSQELLEDLQVIVLAMGRGEPWERAARDLPAYWYSALIVMQAHLDYKRGFNGEALARLVHATGPIDPVYAAAQLRLFWDKRWHAGNRDEFVRDSIYEKFGEEVGEWICDKPAL